MKKYFLSVFASVAVIACLSACGGSGSSADGAGPASADIAPPSTAVSNDGEVVVGAVFFGGTLSNDAIPQKSVGSHALESSVRKLIADHILPRVADAVRENIKQSSLAKSVTATSNANNTGGTIVIDNEKIALSDGTVIFNGKLDGVAQDDLHYTVKGDISANLEDVAVPIQNRGATYSEIVNGTIDLGVDVAGTFTKNASGQYTGLTMDNDILIKASKMDVTGDVVGNVSDMNISFHFDSDDTPEGIKIKSSTCNGYVALEVSGAQMTCGILSSCDGCAQPN